MTPTPMTPTASTDEAAPKKPTPRRHKRDRHTRRIVFGLTGALGFAWAVVIASRYTGLVAG
ncbi:hypothetical protein [Methylobacterium gossipiicola]|uniref:Uncharacterized protein n=1 Tax=Methylobacterium gossipiicola TaxID=582675 RepID=A0A1I2TET1_9HYPH|nr:hypothetical protein [Methylobacterium gossipiicola]SFG63340.1 hypothetical protein SAMN05192565_10732 [Methylobacterium gossipiicola]